MTIFEASHFVQYLITSYFVLKQKVLPQCDRNTALSIDPSHNYTLNASVCKQNTPTCSKRWDGYPTGKANEET